MVWTAIFLFWQLFFSLIEFEGQGQEKHKLEYLHCSFHFGSFAIVCFNENLTKCSIHSLEFIWDVSNTGRVSGHCSDTLSCLSSRLVQTVLTHTCTSRGPNKWEDKSDERLDGCVTTAGCSCLTYLSVAKGLLCSACHIQRYSSLLFFCPFVFGSLIFLCRVSGEKTWRRGQACKDSFCSKGSQDYLFLPGPEYMETISVLCIRVVSRGKARHFNSISCKRQ